MNIFNFLYFQKSRDVTQIPKKLDMFVRKKFMFRINVDSRNVKGVSSMYLATRMSDNIDLKVIPVLVMKQLNLVKETWIPIALVTLAKFILLTLFFLPYSVTLS